MLSEADQYLLDQIRRGVASGWEELIQRYQVKVLADSIGIIDINARPKSGKRKSKTYYSQCRTQNMPDAMPTSGRN